MNNLEPILYILRDETSYLIGLSTFPEVEAKFHLEQGTIARNCQLICLTRGLNWSIADYIYQQITELRERKGFNTAEQRLKNKFFNFFWELDVIDRIIEDKLREVTELLAYYGLEDKVEQRVIDITEIEDIKLPNKKQSKEVYQLLQGRRLYQSEIRKLLRQNQVQADNLNKILVYLKLKEVLQIIPSIKYGDNQISCQRCGSQKELVKQDCNYCGLQDYYCEECILMGEARSCRPLYLIPAPNKKRELDVIHPNLDFQLTSLQQDVSRQLINFLYQDYDQALVWAVCGAGKTEVTFAAIADILSVGGKVLFAIPRKDVVIELITRLQRAFPQIKVKALYGGSINKYQQAQLVVATTHQVLRYYRSFDLIVLDEMDAFPYRDNKVLKRAVKEAKKGKGKIIYMTATPTEQQFKKAKTSNSKLIKLSARYHGYPLPEPELIKANLDYNKKEKELNIPEVVIEKLKLSIEQDLAQVFLFVPSRKLVNLVVEELTPHFPKINGQSWVQGSHSKDKYRQQKREAFLAGDYPILVSTTIMERGITLEKANVIVLFSDWDYIFSYQTLIQMAGRSGRSLIYPQGRVWFIASKINSEMKAARDRIRELNRDARERGYLIK